MHPDKKVGLALGILLIGITGAFFFRNDAPAPREETLTLTDPESLDRKARQKPGAPYFPETDSVSSNGLSGVAESSPSDVIPELPQVDSMAYPRAVAEPVGRHLSQVPIEQFADRTAPLPVPGHDLDVLDQTLTGALAIEESSGNSNSRRAASGSSESAGSPPATKPAKPAFITHEVVAGDNLSRLAQKYLGSHAKYLTLYEANRDLLASPDDLSPGMKLKIPQQHDGDTGQRSTSPKEQESGAGTAGTKVSAARKPSFVQPGRKSVIALGGSRRAGRSLTQSPPPGLPRVEGLDPAGDPAVIASRPE